MLKKEILKVLLDLAHVNLSFKYIQSNEIPYEKAVSRFYQRVTVTIDRNVCRPLNCEIKKSD